MQSQYDTVSTNVQLFSKKNRKVAEIDILAEREGEVDIYEVKCSYRPIKARRQLAKIKKLLPRVTRGFFFCGESGTIEVLI